MGSWLTGDSPEDQMKLVNTQVDAAEKAYNDYLKMVQGQVQGSGYDFFAPKTTTSQSTTRINQLVSPETTKEYMKLDSLARGILENRMGMGEGVSEGEKARAIANINKAYQGAEASAANMAAGRGLSGAQAYGVSSPIQAARASEMANYLAGTEEEGRQRMNQTLGIEAQRQGAFGTAQRTTGTTSTTGSQTGPASIEEYLAYLQMLRPYERPIINPQARQGALGGIIQAGAGLAGDIWGK